MFHDFVKSDGSNRYLLDSSKKEVVKCSGFMDSPVTDPKTNKIVSNPPKRWSGCSVHDFRKAFKDEGWDKIFKIQNSTCFVGKSTPRISINQFICLDIIIQFYLNLLNSRNNIILRHIILECPVLLL